MRLLQPPLKMNTTVKPYLNRSLVHCLVWLKNLEKITKADGQKQTCVRVFAVETNVKSRGFSLDFFVLLSNVAFRYGFGLTNETSFLDFSHQLDFFHVFHVINWFLLLFELRKLKITLDRNTSISRKLPFITKKF